ncbi:NHP6B Chromatin-associated protein containing the HMG domain [Pyrenophora tritici-repentis]|nr:hmg box protein [Pyrenophora tritici-repentis]KAI0592511.1 hmg box protein [Pyrenophora tritici-repentis]KAI0615055.1 hmg box protein [Pyrenophora tritici-repentis]KAI0627358.1 hmg box protein [Pyrenophora tritici-repentis]KAI1547338.1 NHP6B Chromatin-associated protein containing the HMG domain [Pyrenophora tritici-repentis]
MLAGALCRLAGEVPKTSPHDMPQLAHLLGRTLFARNASCLTSVRAFSRAYTSVLSSRRSYATTTRATKPTATVKKAVKTAAAKKPATKAKATPGKKAAPAKKTAKTTAKKPAAKKAAKKKPAAKKPGRKRVKKVLTPEEKEKAKIRELRAKALKEPVSQHAVSPFHVYIAEKLSGSKGTSAEARANVGTTAKAFKNLTPAELEHYNHLANQKMAEKQAEFKAWLYSHTPDEIRIANNARAQLRKKLAGTQKKGVAYTKKLVDDRVPKQKPTSYLRFFLERHASGDFKSIKAADAAKLIGTEWKALSAAEKKKYQDESRAAS